MAHSEGDASLPRRRRGFTVNASPFNAVKLDLALIVIVAAVLILVHDRLLQAALAQLLLLAGYGVAAMCWIVVRTRRISRRLAQQESQQESGTDK